LESKNSVKSISISDVDHDRVLFEGDIGNVNELSIIDSKSLEIIGENGVIRVDISTDKLVNVIESPNQTITYNTPDRKNRNVK
jgi:hypothetical protein